MTLAFTSTASSSSSLSLPGRAAMGRRLRGLVAALKDKAALTKAALGGGATTNSAVLAVLRATTHHPSTSPPHPRHVSALLAYGHGPRASAAALVAALTSRLASARDPTVALKSLLALHHLLSRGAFILRDQLSSALLPSTGRNPLNLSSFRDGSSAASWALSDWVRWYARVLEALLAAARAIPGPFPATQEDERIASLLNEDLLGEIEALVRVVEEVSRPPEAAPAGNELLWEAGRLAEEDRRTAERGIVARVRETGERLGSFRFADSVELVCLGRRLEGCKDRPMEGKWPARSREWFWGEVEDVLRRAKELVVKEEEERGGGRIGRQRLGVSMRMSDRLLLGSTEPVRFGSSRWVVVER